MRSGNSLNNKRSKQPAIELLRLIGAILVILAHSQLYPVVGDTMNKGRLLISTIMADDVPIFILVTGFFFFSRVKEDKDVLPAYIYKLKAYFINIWLPSFIIMIVYCLYGIKKFGADWTNLWGFLFRQTPGNHLWFVCTYFQFVVFFPLLAYVCRDERNRNIARRIVLLISVLGAVIADIQYAMNKEMLDKETQFGLSYTFIFLILGYEISVVLPKIKKHFSHTIVLGAVIYVSGIIIKYSMQILMFNRYNVYENRFRWLQCTPCFITATGLFILVYSLNDLLDSRSAVSKTISFLGGKMFYVFLVHQLVIYQTAGIRNALLEINKGCMAFGHLILYYIEYAAIVFVISLATAFILDLIYTYAIGKWLKKIIIKN